MIGGDERRAKLPAVLSVLHFVLLTAAAHGQHAGAGHDHAAESGVAASGGAGFFTDLFKVYTPRRVCMFYEQPLIWLHAVSDLMIAGAYFTIPFVLLRIVRSRRDVTFGWAFWMFAAFILGCGVTHLIGVVDLWYPLYKIDGLAKLFTGLVSVATAVAIWPLVRRVETLQSPAQLRQTIDERTAELRRVNAELQGQRDLLRAITEGSDDLIFAKDQEGRMIFANPATLRVFGRGEAEALGKSDLELAPSPEQARRIIENDRQVMARGITQDIEEEFGPPGDVHIYASRKSPLRDANRNVIGLLGIARDITEWRRLTNELERQRRLLKSLTDNAAVSLFIMDEHQQCVFMNPAAEAMTGFTLDEVRGKALHDVIHHTRPDGTPYPLSECPIDQARPLNNRERGEEVFVHKDGHFYNVAFTASPLRDESGKPVGTVIEVQDVTEQKRAEERRRQGEALLSAVLDALPVSVLIAEKGGKLVRMNRASELIWGPAPMSESVEGYREWTGYWPESGRRVEPHEWPMSRAVLHGQTSLAVPVEIERFDGKGRRSIELSAAPVVAEGGQVIGGVVACMDVTERVRAERALRASEERFRTVFEAAAVGMGRVSFNDERWVDANDALCRMVGRTREEMLATPWPRITHPDDVDLDLILFRRMAAGELDSYTVEKRFVHKQGHHVWARLTLSLVRDADGRPDYEIAIVEDVTERKRAEEALRENQERLTLAADAAGIGFWTWDVDRNTSVLDETCAALFSLESGRPLPLTDVVDRLHPEDRERVQAAASRAAMGIGRYEVEFRVLRPDGSARWLAGLGNALRRPGEPVRIAGVNWDMTAKKEAEAEREQLLESERAARMEAERASRLKDEFLSTVSHELRTPLNAILGWTQLLLNHQVDRAVDEDLAEGLSIIDRNAKVQVQLIEDLLDMGRIVSGKVRLDLQPVDLREVVEAAVASVRPSAEAKRVELRILTHATTGGWVRGDANRLQQVVWNLLTNAIKFTPPNGTVQVSLARAGRWAEITVSDTGQGINPSFLPHVFERFRQADASITRRHGGLGLGLAIVKNLVELHGGRVRVVSEGEGRGATFTIELPLEAVPLPDRDQNRGEAEAAAQFDACQNLSGVSVLFVDDAPDIREVVARVLADCDADVRIAASAEEGLRLLEAARPDVLVSDIGMPEVDGYEFIRRVRALPPKLGGDVPAIALTAFAREEDRRRALQAGYQSHVTKPVHPAKLIAAIATLAADKAGRTKPDGNA